MVQGKDKKRFMRIFLLISIAILSLLTFSSIRRALILALFVAANFVFAFLKRKIPLGFIRRHFYGIELVLFCTVISSVSFGPVTGALMGGLLIIVNYIAERRLSDYVFITTSLYILVGYLAYYFKEVPIFQLGIIITLSYNFFAFILSKFYGANTLSLVIFSVSNIFFNWFLFYVLAPLIMIIL